MPPIIVAVGAVLIRTTAKQLPKLLRRFKNSKQINNPSSTQINNAERLNKNYTNFSKSEQAVLGKADTANPSFFQKVFGTGRTTTQKKMITNPTSATGEARRQATRNVLKGAGLGSAAVVGGSQVVNKVKGKGKSMGFASAANAKKEQAKKGKVKKMPSTYTVRKGDTYTSIADRTGVTVKKLRELNNIDPKKLQIGKRLKLRSSNLTPSEQNKT